MLFLYASFYFTSAASFFFFLKIKDLKRITFITRKNPIKIKNVNNGSCGASVANSIIGKPNTIAGNVW